MIRSTAAVMLRMVTIVLGAQLASGTALANEAGLLVVPMHGKAGPAFDAAVSRLIEKPLKRHASVVSPSAYRAAARRIRLRRGGLRMGKNIQKLGAAAGAEYVLIIEATGRRPRLAANTTLVDVASGRTLSSDRYSLPGGRLTAEVAAQILSPILDQLGTTGNAQDDGSVAENGKPGKAGKKNSLAWSQGDESADPTEPGAGDDESVEQDAEETSSDASTTAPGERGPRWRPALRIGAGMFAMRREARLTAGDERLPCYCGKDGKNNPFFFGPTLELDLFPLAFNGNGESALEGLGLHADAAFSVVRSHVGDSTEEISSTVYNVKVGPTYRLVWWDSPTAVETQFTVGYSLYGFPLSKGAFPGVSYNAPFVGVSARIPLGMEQLALVVGGNGMFPMSVGDGAAKTLGKGAGGSAYNLEGGLRFAYDRFDVTALTRWQTYSATFSGDTQFPSDVGKQFSNVRLKEQQLQFLMTVGVSF